LDTRLKIISFIFEFASILYFFALSGFINYYTSLANGFFQRLSAHRDPSNRRPYVSSRVIRRRRVMCRNRALMFYVGALLMLQMKTFKYALENNFIHFWIREFSVLFRVSINYYCTYSFSILFITRIIKRYRYA